MVARMATSLAALMVVWMAALSGAGGVRSQPRELFLVKQEPLELEYHRGALLKGNYTLDLVWYGLFSAAQRAVLTDFLASLSSSSSSAAAASREPVPSAADWWRITESYSGGATRFTLGKQLLLEDYPKGKFLSDADVRSLAASPRRRSSISVVFTAADVAVEGFCRSRCGSHAAAEKKRVYIWVGNSEAQCPGQCAWPFHQPPYGPQAPPLAAPNGDVAADGMVINLAALMAGTVTNPFAGGYFQGPAAAPLEAVSACSGVFGAGAYPGSPGKVATDEATGGSYNAVGVGGRKFLLPAMWDPKTARCATLL